jgi:type IV pilus assembly protein PilB
VFRPVRHHSKISQTRRGRFVDDDFRRPAQGGGRSRSIPGQPARRQAIATERRTAIDEWGEWRTALADSTGAAVEKVPADRRVAPPRRSRLGRLLVERGMVTEEQLEHALEGQRASGGRLGETLVERGVVSSVELAAVLADHLGVPFVDLRSGSPDLVLAALIPENVARRYNALPVARWGEQLVIAMANPSDVFAVDDLRVLTGSPVIAALAEPQQLLETLDRAYQHARVESSLGDATTDTAPAIETSIADDPVMDGPMVRLVEALLEQAAKDKASDLHIEPTTDKVIIRLRIDGVLHDTSEAPLSVLRPMVSRLKVLSGLDIAQSRLPQDGRFSTTLQGRPVDVRVATIPTVTGEGMVLRMLDASRGVIDLPSLGLSATELARFEPAFRAAQGGVFVTGPTGSGKTSTLYAALSAISTRDKSIVSVEDPVEYRLYGVRQIQAHPKAGLTFPVALRSILRADPDVIFVGEVRDGETARMAAEAAITGHLVLSSLHTTRAAAAPVRLVDMGIESYLVASSLTCVAAQRLVRRLCDECARPVGREDATRLLRDLDADDALLDTATLRAPVGCPACRETGYRSRTAIFEIMPVSEHIARLIVERAATADIESVAVAEGMDTLRTAALKRVVAGDLGVDEMLRVIS